MRNFNHVQINKQELQRIEENGKRFYVTPEGNRYPSVTTVTGHAKKAFFAEWRKNNPDEAKRVTVRGTRFHSLVEKYLNNEVMDRKKINFADLFLFSQAEVEIDKIDNIHLLETTLWSDTLKLAGRVDCIAEFDGRLSVIDFKSASKEKPASDIKEYFMQATAYAIMYQERYGKAIDNIVIIMSSEDGMVNVYQVNPIQYVKELFDTIKEYNSSAELVP
jgi:CRISPR/Cas system-associated exonuclease Cas4 (RecB family)